MNYMKKGATMGGDEMFKMFFACFLGSFIGQIFSAEIKGFIRGLKK
mgnify:CR=1 FL=1